MEQESTKWLSRVVWSEGMHLGPHHFQIQSRYFEDAIHFVARHAWFEPWGFISYKLDEHAILNGNVALSYAHGIFKDGLAFVIPECDEKISQLNITENLPGDRSVLVLLAVPKRKDNAQNCDLEGNHNHCRYWVKAKDFADVNNGRDRQLVNVAEKNIAIITERDLDGSMSAIPLARITRNSEGRPSYDPCFVPPCTNISASSWLMTLLAELIGLFDAKRQALLSPVADGNFRSGLSQREVAKFWFLHTINDALSQLRHLYTSKKGHPEELFRELSRIAGALCTFNLQSDPSTLPAYDHEDLGSGFFALGDHIRKHLEILLPSNAIPVPIRRVAPHIYVGKVDDQRCFGRTRWVLGMGSSAGEAAVLANAPDLIKICSAEFVEERVNRALPGLALIHLQTPPSAVSPRLDLQYFSISKSGRCWDHIVTTRAIGIYVPDELANPVLELQVIVEG